MTVIFAVDALEYKKIEEFDCENMKQADYGKTDISEFDQPRTMILWSSFMTGENKEEEILSKVRIRCGRRTSPPKKPFSQTSKIQKSWTCPDSPTIRSNTKKSAPS